MVLHHRTQGKSKQSGHRVSKQTTPVLKMSSIKCDCFKMYSSVELLMGVFIKKYIAAISDAQLGVSQKL